jgi:hypothetical protein
MSLDRREQERIRQAAYNQLEHRKEERRQASKAKSKEHKLNTTEKRLEEHSIDDLLRIARRKCAASGIDFATHESEITRVLNILHGTQIVQSTGI